MEFSEKGRINNAGEGLRQENILTQKPNKVITVTGVNYYGIILHC